VSLRRRVKRRSEPYSSKARTKNYCGAKQNEKTIIYLIDAYNHTGYAQVLEEKDVSLAVTKSYTIGDDIISQTTGAGTEYLLCDGHGSTRQLSDSSGTLIPDESYSYDAYGVMLGGNPTSASPAGTSMLYAGEQFDTSLQMYYNRARYYDQNIGRFNRMDPFAGSPQDPQSLHKYLYVHNNPVNGIDPTGKFTITDLMTTMSNIGTVMSITAPVWTPIASYAAWYLIPADFRNKIEYFKPDAILLGSSANAGMRGWDMSLGLEAMFSPGTRKAAIFGSGSFAGSSGSQAHAGVSLYGGLVWAQSTKDYRGFFSTMTISLRSVPSKVQNKIIDQLITRSAQLAGIDFGLSAAGANGYRVVDLIAQGSQYINQLSDSPATLGLDITFSCWPGGAKAVTIGRSLSVGNTGSKFRIGLGLTKEFWPKEPGGTKL